MLDFQTVKTIKAHFKWGYRQSLLIHVSNGISQQFSNWWVKLREWFLRKGYIVWLVVWLPFFIFPHIGNLIIPIDELIFFRGVAQPPTSSSSIVFIYLSIFQWWNISLVKPTHWSSKSEMCVLDCLMFLTPVCQSGTDPPIFVTPCQWGDFPWFTSGFSR